MAMNKIKFIVEYSTAASPLKDVVDIPGLKWSVQYYKHGRNNDMNAAEVTIRVYGGSAEVFAGVRAGSEKRKFSHVFADGDEHGCQLRDPDIFHQYNLTCYAIFKSCDRFPASVMDSPRTFQLIDNSMPHCFNAEIVVGNDRLKVHRGFLSMLSPVFTAAFTHKTKEAETGILEIKDFDFKTVKNAIDYLYGRKISSTSAVEIVDILRFVDKYDIQPAMALLEKQLKANLNIGTFAGIATYAWQYDRKELQQKCGQLYRNNVYILALHPDFAKLEPTVMAGVVTLASTGSL